MSNPAHKNRLFQLTGLSADDLADTIEANPRAYMNLKGAVAEKHLSIYLQALLEQKNIDSYRCGLGDFEKDFYVQVRGRRKPVVIECKNVQVINLSNMKSKSLYLDFLRERNFLSDEHLAKLFPKGRTSFTDATQKELAEAFLALPIELRESGMSRYTFGRTVCGVDGQKTLSAASCKTYLKAFDAYPISIDFQRTRNARADGAEDNKSNRFYKVGEIDIVAACIFSRTLEWKFIFCSAKRLVRHEKHQDRYSNKVIVNPDAWKADLLAAIADL